MLDFIYRLFPPPKFLDFQAIGLDISDRSIKYAEFQETKNGIRLKRWGSKELAQGTIEAGEIKKPEELSANLSAIFKPLAARHVVAALPEERAYISVMSLPQAEKGEIREAVELGLPEQIPLPAGDAAFDFEFMPRSARPMEDGKIDEDQSHNDAVVYAFPKTLARSYLDVLLNSGLRPVSFIMETAALGRALIPEKKENKPIMIVDFGKTRTTFVIVANGLVRFSSTVSVAGESLDKAIAKALGVSVKEGEKIKKEAGMLKTEKNETVYSAILPVVAAVADEIERHIIFWNTHAEHVHQSDPKISKVVITGGDSNLIGFKTYLGLRLGISIETGNPWTNVAPFEKYIPEIPLNESLGYSTAIGLGLTALNKY